MPRLKQKVSDVAYLETYVLRRYMHSKRIHWPTVRSTAMSLNWRQARVLCAVAGSDLLYTQAHHCVPPKSLADHEIHSCADLPANLMDGEAVRTFPINQDYEVSSFGRIRRIGNVEWLKPHARKRLGYLVVNLTTNGRNKTYRVNRAVAITYLGPAPEGKTDVAHCDDDTSNNRVENLRWATRRENEQDKLLRGRTPHGERHACARLSNADVVAIRASSEPSQDVAAKYGVSAAHIRAIIRGAARRRA